MRSAHSVERSRSPDPPSARPAAGCSSSTGRGFGGGSRARPRPRARAQQRSDGGSDHSSSSTTSARVATSPGRQMTHQARARAVDSSSASPWPGLDQPRLGCGATQPRDRAAPAPLQPLPRRVHNDADGAHHFQLARGRRALSKPRRTRPGASSAPPRSSNIFRSRPALRSRPACRRRPDATRRRRGLQPLLRRVSVQPVARRATAAPPRRRRTPTANRHEQPGTVASGSSEPARRTWPTSLNWFPSKVGRRRSRVSRSRRGSAHHQRPGGAPAPVDRGPDIAVGGQSITSPLCGPTAGAHLRIEPAERSARGATVAAAAAADQLGTLGGRLRRR